jgi:hypothetical protein
MLTLAASHASGASQVSGMPASANARLQAHSDPPGHGGGGAIARRPDGRQSEKHRIKGGGAIACGLLLTCVYGCRVHVISCVFLYPIMHPVRIQAKIVRSEERGQERCQLQAQPGLEAYVYG